MNTLSTGPLPKIALTALASAALAFSAGPARAAAEPSNSTTTRAARLSRFIDHVVAPNAVDGDAIRYFAGARRATPSVKRIPRSGLGALHLYPLTRLEEFAMYARSGAPGSAVRAVRFGFWDTKSRVVSLGGHTRYGAHVDLAAPTSIESDGDKTTIEYKLSLDPSRRRPIVTMPDRIRFHITGDELESFDLKLRSVAPIAQGWYHVDLAVPTKI